MDSFPVVKELNISKDLSYACCLVLNFVTVNQFFFQDAVKGLNASIIITIAFTTHTGRHLVLSSCFRYSLEAYCEPRSEW